MRLSLLRLGKADVGRCSGVIITDHEYPVRPAFSLLTKLLDDFIAKVPVASYASPAAISFPEANSYIAKYQDPRQADAIMKVQQELDETKIILVSVGSLATGGRWRGTARGESLSRSGCTVVLGDLTGLEGLHAAA